MSYTQRENSGVLFKNNDKKTEKHPDYKGNLNVEGVEYFFDAWKKVSAKGDTFLSVSVKKKNVQRAATPAPDATPEDQDDIPF